MKTNRLIYQLAVAAVAALLLASCSTTRRIPDDDILYTGLKGVKFETPDSVSLPSAMKTSITDAVNVRPNNSVSILGFVWRYPFPLGLWVYNNWPNPEKGFKHWIYEKLAAEPVLMSDVRPEVRTHMIEQILDNNGYFSGTATYELVQGRNKKKAKLLYTVNSGKGYPIDTLELLPDSCALYRTIDSLALADRYLASKSPRFSTDSLSIARTRIVNGLRNKGYYFFTPSYIEFLADSVARRGHIALRMTLASNMPKFAREQFRTGDVTVHLDRYQGGGTPDTIETKRATLIQMKPSRFRTGILNESITMRKGRIFSVRNMDRTQSYLSRLGIFNSIDIQPKVDSAAIASGVLDVDIYATFDSPLEASIEVNASSKSNSYIGPGITLGLTNKNVFGGGEQLSVKLTGAYEWQTGSANKGGVFNSYEAGLNASLAFPRLLAPKFFRGTRRELNWTRINLGADILNRPHYFKMAQFNTGISYDWRYRRHVANTFTPLKITYTKLIHTTEEFDSIMNANPAVAQSFKSQFIPQMSFSYVYDRAFGRNNTLNWSFTLQEAGNIFWGIYEACGKRGDKKLFGLPFSQFVKGQAQLVWGRRLGRGDQWLVSRVAAGAAHAYGNSTQVPYSEQFYIGGANSVRAFTVRSIGPGSYRGPEGSDAIDNFDRTGTFKFEANVEYRFPIFSIIHGALFVDSGNIWLLKEDAQRPGGLLKASNFLKDLALGTGAGVRVDISMLVVRLDLGVGIHCPYDTGKSGYYNMQSFKKSLALHLAIGYPF
ncbi:MAG: BamA/TamA family outer membrane protein [Muribaculaceae bacterium]|nr:BamA/TamA family outer membrane protein [Muribaculaceae bacterium]